MRALNCKGNYKHLFNLIIRIKKIALVIWKEKFFLGKKHYTLREKNHFDHHEMNGNRFTRGK